ncbi:MAG: glycosyltransferase, partial [Actinomycetia bacterium]|nr:glycosyltransferase [Actinomycetes bacterium]
GLVAAARARGADHDEEMASVVDDLVTAETLERVIEQVPDELAEATDTQLGQRSVMTPQQLRTWLESVTTA